MILSDISIGRPVTTALLTSAILNSLAGEEQTVVADAGALSENDEIEIIRSW